MHAHTRSQPHAQCQTEPHACTQSHTHAQPHTHSHTHTWTCRCVWQRPHPPTHVQPCTRMCSSCPWQGPVGGSSPSKGTPGLGSVGPGQCGCCGMPAVQQGDHHCGGKWHPRGLSLACDRPRSALAAPSPLRGPRVCGVSFSRGLCEGVAWWGVVARDSLPCMGRTPAHTCARTHRYSGLCTHAFTFSAAPMLSGTQCHTHVCVCAGGMHTRVCTQAVLRRHMHLPVCLCSGNTRGSTTVGMQTCVMHWEHA